ncbi:MAG TPA: hypothetical protein VFJ43_13105, partial [Bacteroidia bacterium]|nr:hypothetical protein [Bacteroidia bacterium]
ITKDMNYKLFSSDSYFSDFNILEFTYTFARISFFLVLILSLINPFIRKNKLSVKITSIIILVICGLVIYQLLTEFSHPVMKAISE